MYELGGRDRASLEMNLEAKIEYLRDALGCRNGARLEMHLEAIVVRTWRLQSSEFEDATGGHAHAN